MTKTELIKESANRAGVTIDYAADVINAALEVVAARLEAGDSIRVQGFGALSIREHKARKAYNFHTGETMEGKAHKSVGFMAYGPLKDRVNGGNNG